MEYLTPAARQEWRDHWRVVVGAGIGMACGYSAFPFVASLFVQPLEQAFGWTRGQQALSHNANLVAALLAPAIGTLVDAHGVRRVLLPAIGVVGLFYAVLANLTPSITHYYIAMSLLVLTGMATTGLSYTRAVTSWFRQSRGLALAVSRLGLAVAGAVLPMAVYGAIHRWGYTGGFYTLGAVILLLGWPVSWALVSDRRTAVEERREAAGATGWRMWPSLLRNRRILLICLAAGLTYGPAVGLLTQMQPLLISKGVEPATAASLLSLLAVSTFLGTLITGAIVDRVWAPILGFLFTMGPVAGCAVLMSLAAPGAGVAAIAVVLIGLAQGAEIDLIGYMIARYFGMQAFSAIYGLTVLATGVCSAAGAMLIGQLYDRLGGYNPALGAAAACFLVASFTYLLLGRYPR
ncbi:MFS transporter [Nitrospirillum sp. BR 11164]|uniref:MFS transporter n=1 Tax=Nitrospirillum sp. BR 11164 TaxID=3104324 RepID=UPI002B0012A6|nr:MFS transporter [Nitrospirillum sp. BR 11164]MEA1652874.1 MFS transporter [Nitrospirillum sp. BR 11164]